MADIVYVDDDPFGFMSLLRSDEQGRLQEFEFGESFPALEALEAAKTAKVWLFDFFLVADRQASTDDENGLSFFQKWKREAAGARPTTVLLSSQLEQAIGEPIGKIERRHAIAQRHGVEWIGEKDENTLRQVIELADAALLIGGSLNAIQAKTLNFGTYNLEQLCYEVLRAPRDAEWASSAQRQIDRARPPREVPIATEAATARAIIGWLISHVLPYPSFLLTDAQAALRLQMTPAGFVSLSDYVDDADGNEHRARLAACRYTGPLDRFLGRRWWRAGVDDLAWRLSEAEGGFAAGFEALMGNFAVERLDDFDEPVLVSDADLIETSEIADARDCVRVTDEDFPANVEPAWVRIADVRENRQLAAKVIFEDRDLVEAHPS
jgi:hypothetical protein